MVSFFHIYATDTIEVLQLDLLAWAKRAPRIYKLRHGIIQASARCLCISSIKLRMS